jgi:hypothetical protein
MNERKAGIKIKVQESKVQEMRSSAGNKQERQARQSESKCGIYPNWHSNQSAG